jgi:tagatose 1,6-diphosphate aldolase
MTDLSDPPSDLACDEVRLRFERIFDGDASRGMVPYYHFRVISIAGADVGHINFRVGDTEHVNLCAGHVGFQIRPEFRGHGYARQACLALAPFVRTLYPNVKLTCDPDNVASRRTIERLGATYLDQIEVPPHDVTYENGARRKLRYLWTP